MGIPFADSHAGHPNSAGTRKDALWLPVPTRPNLIDMDYRTLGSSNLKVSAVGLGCMGMSQAYGPSDDASSAATLRGAVDLGVTFWDTSMSYGRGHNERLLAGILTSHRDEIVLATKFGIVRDENGIRVDGRPENVQGYCEASLQRLGVDHIDLFYQHRVDPDVPIEETVGAMATLVNQGKVGHLGLSEASSEELGRAVNVHPIAALQCEWSLWWRDVEDEIIPAARHLGIGIVPYSPLGRGFFGGTVNADGLSDGDRRHTDPRFSGPAGENNRRLFAELQALATRRGVTVAQLAIAWLLAQGDDVVPIPGTKRIDLLEENTGAVDIGLTPAELDQLDHVVPRQAWAGDRVAFAGRQLKRTSGSLATDVAYSDRPSHL